LPVTRGTRLTGILTNRDLRFEKNHNQLVSSVMTKDHLVTVPVGTTLDEAERLLQKHRIEKLLVVDQDFNLKGLITVKDIQKKLEYPSAAKDEHGRLRVGAAIGATGDFLERAVEMAKYKTDVLAIDTAHGHSARVMDAIKAIRQRLPDVQLIAGNVATYEGAKDLIALGIDGLKVGMGPGSICTTRVVTGAGVPQITAITEAARAAEGILYQGRTFKSYRGMGSTSAMEEGSADRYAQEDEDVQRGKSVPEGVEGRVPYKGSLAALTDQLVGGLRSGMGYVGAENLKELAARSKFVRITSAGLRESHVHDVIITREAPNYRME
jgi:IMP dehydrogenase